MKGLHSRRVRAPPSLPFCKAGRSCFDEHQTVQVMHSIQGQAPDTYVQAVQLHTLQARLFMPHGFQTCLQSLERSARQKQNESSWPPQSSQDPLMGTSIVVVLTVMGMVSPQAVWGLHEDNGGSQEDEEGYQSHHEDQPRAVRRQESEQLRLRPAQHPPAELQG